MCWHKWTVWVDVKVEWATEDLPGGGQKRTPHIHKQQRRCVKCQMIDSRTLA